MHLTIKGMVGELSQLSSLMLSMESVDRIVWAAAGIAVSAIDAVTACGVTVARYDALISLMPELAKYCSLENLQYTNNDGPIIDAINGGDTVLVTDMGGETRWSEYPHHALAAGVGASLVLPLRSDGGILGALTLYASKPEEFAESGQLAELIAELTSTALCCMLENSKQTTLSAQLQQALESRAVIDQAKGMIMMQRQCDGDGAFAVLQETSQRRNVKLRDVATEIVAAMCTGR